MTKLLPSVALASAVLFAPVAHAESSPSTAAAVQAAAPVNATAGTLLYDANGARIARIDRVAADGRVRVILDSRFVTVPAASLSVVNGKIITSLTKAELRRSAR